MYGGHMTNSSPAEIAERVNQERRKQARHITWLAEQSGIADKTLRRRFIAPDRMTLGELISLASALNLTIEDIVSGRAELREENAA